MPDVHSFTASSPTPQKNNRQALRKVGCEEHMAQSHPYGKAHLNRRARREGTRSKANTRDSQALPIEQ